MLSVLKRQITKLEHALNKIKEQTQAKTSDFEEKKTKWENKIEELKVYMTKAEQEVAKHKELDALFKTNPSEMGRIRMSYQYTSDVAIRHTIKQGKEIKADMEPLRKANK